MAVIALMSILYSSRLTHAYNVDTQIKLCWTVVLFFSCGWGHNHWYSLPRWSTSNYFLSYILNHKAKSACYSGYSHVHILSLFFLKARFSQLKNMRLENDKKQVRSIFSVQNHAICARSSVAVLSPIQSAIQLLNGCRIYPLSQRAPSKLYRIFFHPANLPWQQRLFVVRESSFMCRPNIGRHSRNKTMDKCLKFR